MIERCQTREATISFWIQIALLVLWLTQTWVTTRLDYTNTDKRTTVFKRLRQFLFLLFPLVAGGGIWLAYLAEDARQTAEREAASERTNARLESERAETEIRDLRNRIILVQNSASVLVSGAEAEGRLAAERAKRSEAEHAELLETLQPLLVLARQRHPGLNDQAALSAIRVDLERSPTTTAESRVPLEPKPTPSPKAPTEPDRARHLSADAIKRSEKPLRATKGCTIKFSAVGDTETTQWAEELRSLFGLNGWGTVALTEMHLPRALLDAEVSLGSGSSKHAQRQ